MVSKDSTASAMRAALAASIAVGIAALLALGERGYHTNDDAVMSALASGDYTGHPDGRLVFIQPLVSFPISWMYRLVPTVPWYGLTLYAAFTLALVVIGDVLLRRRQDFGAVATLVVAGCVVAVAPRMLLSISFTATAAVAFAASVVLAVDVATSSSWRAHWVRGTVTATLLILGVSIRPDSALAVFAVSAPLLAMLAVRFGRPGLTYLATAAATLMVNRAIVRFLLDAEYRSFLAYNEVRGSLHATPRISAEVLTPDVLGRIGWSSVDRGMFSYFLFDDRQRFGFDSISTIASDSSAYRAPLTRTFLFDQVVLAYPWLLASVFVIVSAAFIARNAIGGSIVLFQVAIAVAALTWVGLTARLPERVSLPVWSSLIVTAGCAALLRPDVRRIRGGTRLPLAASVWALVLVVAVWSGPIGPSATSRFNGARSDALERQLDLINAESDVGVFVAYGGAITTQGADPLALRGPLADRRILALGWDTFSPAFEARKASVGVSDSLRVILKRSDVVWVANETVTAYYVQFLRREVGIDEQSVLKSTICIQAPELCLWRLSGESTYG